MDKNSLAAAATAAVIDAETSVRVCRAGLPEYAPPNPREHPETSAQLKGVTAYHKACVSLQIALFSLLAVEKRLTLDQETQRWASEWYTDVSEDCKIARRDLAKIMDSGRFVDAMPTETNWTGGWSIGFGTFANVYLFVRHDENGMISNRVVAKDNYYEEHDTWRYDCFWTTMPNGERIPNEVKAMFDLRGKQGSEFIVKILNWRMSTAARFFRIYTEYLPFGDAYDMVDAQIIAKKSVPEPFIWHFFECLAIAGLLMERGELQRNPTSTWQTIVHRDIKLGNVFLDRSSNSKYRRYPTPKLGDFGAAVYLSPDTPRKAEDYNYAGTPDCHPVEQIPHINSGRTVSSKSNVWAVASAAASMIWGTEGFNGLNYGQEEGGVSEPSFDDSKYERFSDELRNLILHCMRYDQDDRPDFTTLLRMIRDARKSGLDAGLRDEPASSDKWTPHLLIDLEDKVNPLAQVYLDDDHDSDCEIGGAAGTELLRAKQKDATPPETNSSPERPQSNPSSGSRLDEAAEPSVKESEPDEREKRGDESRQQSEHPEEARQHESVGDDRLTAQGQGDGEGRRYGSIVQISQDGQADPDEQADNDTQINQNERVDQQKRGNPSEELASAASGYQPPASEAPTHQGQDEVNAQEVATEEEEQNIPEDQAALGEAEPAVAGKNEKKRKKVTETAASSRPKRHKPNGQQ